MRGRRGEREKRRREDGEKKMVYSRLINKIVYDGLCYIIRTRCLFLLCMYIHVPLFVWATVGWVTLVTFLFFVFS